MDGDARKALPTSGDFLRGAFSAYGCRRRIKYARRAHVGRLACRSCGDRRPDGRRPATHAESSVECGHVRIAAERAPASTEGASSFGVLDHDVPVAQSCRVSAHCASPPTHGRSTHRYMCAIIKHMFDSWRQEPGG